MDFHPMEHLDKLGVAVVHDLAVADVELCDLCHILVAELEVPDGQVLLHALLVDGLRDDGDAALDVPPQGHLGGALAVFLADGGQHGMGEDAVVALGKETPCFGMDAVLLGCRRVDEAVAGGDGVQHRLLTDSRVGHLEHAKALQGHLHAVVQFDRFDLVHDRSPPAAGASAFREQGPLHERPQRGDHAAAEPPGVLAGNDGPKDAGHPLFGTGGRCF